MKPRGFNESLRAARYYTPRLILQEIIKGEQGGPIRPNHHPFQLNVIKSQGKPVSRKPVIHDAFEVFTNFLRKD
jgi:hypothetical protein